MTDCYTRMRINIYLLLFSGVVVNDGPDLQLFVAHSRVRDLQLDEKILVNDHLIRICHTYTFREERGTRDTVTMLQQH